MAKSRLYGDWKEVDPKLKIVSDKISETMVEEVKKLGKKYNDAIKAHVEKQDLSLESLSQKTVERKGDDRWWIETGEFLDKLSVRVYYKGKKTASVKVGALPDRKYNDYFSMEDLAMMLELGTSTIPGRPLFRLTNEEFEDEFMKLGKETSNVFEILWNKKLGIAVSTAAALSAYLIAKNTVMKRSELPSD